MDEKSGMQIWICCEKSCIKTVKTALEDKGCLDTKRKFMAIEEDDRAKKMLVPTTLRRGSISDAEIWKLLDLEPQVSRLVTVRALDGNDNDGMKHSVEVIGFPIEQALRTWYMSLSSEAHDQINENIEELASMVPKRWSIYTPMVLLPSGSFQSPVWQHILSALSTSDLEQLWRGILLTISKKEGGTFTNLAVNSGIPLTNSTSTEEENILRTPSGLIILHGNFGPALSPDVSPTEQDFKNAFWVSTRQNGIYQTWAPRYTMFSRGNVKEKARLLKFHTSPSAVEGSGREIGKKGVEGKVAVDLYAGIGYFVFSYAKLGMNIVGWEINPWSAEGLRRGAIGNGWSVRIVKGRELIKPTLDILYTLGNWEQIVIFLEDNVRARERVGDMKRGCIDGTALIMHVNMGLLPSCEASWKTAWGALNNCKFGWLHLHENVKEEDIESRRLEIQEIFQSWEADSSLTRSLKTEWVERVKTFAPGVWHCVFDIYIATVKE